MHIEIFDPRQKELLPHLSVFNRSFYLVGGTAIALYLGHRRSIDFDLFTKSTLVKHRLKKKLTQLPFSHSVIFEDVDQLHLLINNVKTTFFQYPYPIQHSKKDSAYFSMPSLLTLAAMKAFALGRSAKWKDYVDLYFIIKDHYRIEEISSESKKIFGDLFSEKLFRQQLAYHKDIDYTEEVEYLTTPVSDKIIKDFLIEEAIKLI